MSKKIVHSATVGRQISVFLDDKPGALAEVCKMLSDRGINIYALSLAEGVGHGYVRMLVDKPDEALRLLQEAEELTMEREVLLVDLVNVTGALGMLTGLLGEAGVNIEYAYCAGGSHVDCGAVVIRVNQTEKALKVLSAM
jgi:hypothetical protein